MNARTAFAGRLVKISGVFMLVLFVALTLVLPQRGVMAIPQALHSPVVAFELARSPDDVFALLGAPGHPARAATVAAMDRGNQIDLLFLLAYGVFTIGVLWWVCARGLMRPGVALAFSVVAVVMMSADAIENICMLWLSRQLEHYQMRGPLQWLRVSTMVKWSALFVSALSIGVHLGREASRWRFLGLGYGGAALAGATALAWVPAIEIGTLVLAASWCATLVMVWRLR